MTDDMKASDAVRYVVIKFGPQRVVCAASFDNEAAARAEAERLVLEAKEGVSYGIYQRTASVRSARTPLWSGRAA